MAYGGDDVYRLAQEVVLGIGGVRMLDALGFRVDKYRMNEGHSALLAVDLLRRHAYAPEHVRPGEGVTGWAIGRGGGDSPDEDARSVHDKLEQAVLPLYPGPAHDPAGWINVMRGAISKNASCFDSHRMMRRYATEAYIR